jgi:hypothetical protein
MKKADYIEKYGLESYEAFKKRQREYAKNHPQKGDRHRPGYYKERYQRKKNQKANRVNQKKVIILKIQEEK